MRKFALATLLALTLPAHAGDGFFAGHDKVLRRTQCTASQVLVCEIRCPASTLADGTPSTQACDVTECRCEDGKIDRPAQSIVIFDARKVLGLPAPK